MINPLILSLPVHLFSHFFVRLFPHSAFIILRLFISLLLYFNPCFVLHFSCNFSKSFSFYSYIYFFSTSFSCRSFFILMGYYRHGHLLLYFHSFILNLCSFPLSHISISSAVTGRDCVCAVKMMERRKRKYKYNCCLNYGKLDGKNDVT